MAEKSLLQTAIEQLEKETEAIENQLVGLNNDIGRLQAKLTEAKARKKSLDMRWQTTNSRLKVRGQLDDGRIDDAMVKFEYLERKMDTLEGRVEAHDLGRDRPLADEFAELAAQDAVEKELAELKKRMREKQTRE